MEQLNRLNPEYQQVLDQFVNFRIKYCAATSSSEAREKLINLQKMELENVNKRFDRLVTAVGDYQARTTATINRLEGELYQANKYNLQLEEKCSEIQASHNNYIDNLNQSHDKNVQRLEEEIQLLQTKIALQEDQHNKNVEQLKIIHQQEIEKRDETIGQLQAKIGNNSTKQMARNTNFNHPALQPTMQDQSKVPPPPSSSVITGNSNKGKKKIPASSVLNWPNLDIKKTTRGEKQQQAKVTIHQDDDKEPDKKKKKLYTNTDDGLYDIEY